MSRHRQPFAYYLTTADYLRIVLDTISMSVRPSVLPSQWVVYDVTVVAEL